MRTNATGKHIPMWIINGEYYMAENNPPLRIFIPLESGISRKIPYGPEAEFTTKRK
jgi:hypothetical protein